MLGAWDPLTKTFFTSGFEKFTGLLQLDLGAIKIPLIAPKRVFLLFGLKPEENQQEIARHSWSGDVAMGSTVL